MSEFGLSKRWFWPAAWLRSLAACSENRSVAILAGGSAVAQMIGLLASPILSRLYGPEDFGVATAFGAVLGALSILATCRYEMAITTTEGEAQAFDLLLLCFALAGATGVVFGTVAWVGRERLFPMLGLARAGAYWWLIPITSVGTAAYQAVYYWALRKKAYGALSKTRFAQAVSGALTSVGVGCCWKGPLGLLLGTLLTQCAGVLTLSKAAFSALGRANRPAGFVRLKTVLVGQRRFAFFTTGAALLNTTGLTLPPLLLAMWFGEKATGQFGLAYRVVALPSTLVGAAVSQVFLAEASQRLRDNTGGVGLLFHSMVRRMAVLALLNVLAALTYPFLFGYVFGARWQEAGTFALVISLYCAAQLVVSPTSCIVILLGRQDLQCVLDGLRAIIVILSLWVPSRIGCSPLQAVGAFSVGMVLVYGLSQWVYARLVAGITPATPCEQPLSAL